MAVVTRQKQEVVDFRLRHHSSFSLCVLSPTQELPKDTKTPKPPANVHEIACKQSKVHIPWLLGAFLLGFELDKGEPV
jgi:hypothetical protein